MLEVRTRPSGREEASQARMGRNGATIPASPQKLRTAPGKGVVYFTLPTPTPHFLLGSHPQRVLGVAASRQESGNFELGECGATDRP